LPPAAPPAGYSVRGGGGGGARGSAGHHATAVQDTKRNAVSIRNQRHPSARSALGQAGTSHSAMDGPRLCVVLARCRKRPRPARLAVSSARRERGSGGGRRGGAAGGEPAHGCLHVARPITLAHWVDTDVGRIRRVQRRAREVVCRHKLRNAHCQKAHRARSARTGARLLTKLNMYGGGYFRLDTNPLLPVRFAKEQFVNTKEPVSCVLTKCSFVFTKCSSDFHILSSGQSHGNAAAANATSCP